MSSFHHPFLPRTHPMQPKNQPIHLPLDMRNRVGKLHDAQAGGNFQFAERGSRVYLGGDLR